MGRKRVMQKPKGKAVIPDHAKRQIRKIARQYDRPVEEIEGVYLYLVDHGYGPLEAVQNIPKYLWMQGYDPERYVKYRKQKMG